MNIYIVSVPEQQFNPPVGVVEREIVSVGVGPVARAEQLNHWDDWGRVMVEAITRDIDISQETGQ